MALDLNAASAIGAVASAIGLGGLPGALSPNFTPLILDDITFAAFEIPAKFGPLGGEQVLAVHNFPGGARTIQTFGAVPAELEWTGILTGPTAADREQALDRKRVSAKVVNLSFGRWSWQGYVAEFTAEIENLFLIIYRIKFVPLMDTSGIATNPQGSTSPDATLAQDTAALNSTTNPNTQVQPLPAAMTPPVTAMQNSLALGNQDSGGVITAIPPLDVAAIEAANLAVQVAAAPIIAGTDATQASPALDATNYSQANVNTIQAVGLPIAEIRAINPNLFALAQQYYGDASMWQLIADASGLPPDPQPVGLFLLQIPPPQ